MAGIALGKAQVYLSEFAICYNMSLVIIINIYQAIIRLPTFEMLKKMKFNIFQKRKHQPFCINGTKESWAVTS